MDVHPPKNGINRYWSIARSETVVLPNPMVFPIILPWREWWFIFIFPSVPDCRTLGYTHRLVGQPLGMQPVLFPWLVGPVLDHIKICGLKKPCLMVRSSQIPFLGLYIINQCKSWKNNMFWCFKPHFLMVKSHFLMVHETTPAPA